MEFPAPLVQDVARIQEKSNQLLTGESEHRSVAIEQQAELAKRKFDRDRYPAPSGLPLSSQAWESMNRIFYRLSQQNREALTSELIMAIRTDVHVRSEGLLHRPVTCTDDAGIPAISLDAALQQVGEQLHDGTGHLDTVSWDRFYWLLLEAHRYRAAPHLRPAHPMPSVKSFPEMSFLESCPVNPNDSPVAAIETRSQLVR